MSRLVLSSHSLFDLPLIRRFPLLYRGQENEHAGIRHMYDQTHLRRLLWYLLGGTRGGPNRAEIIKTLQNRPCNAHQLAEALKVDYKTILHHLKILKENGLITPSEEGAYGAVLFLTPKMEAALQILDEIWSKIGTRNISTQSRR